MKLLPSWLHKVYFWILIRALSLSIWLQSSIWSMKNSIMATQKVKFLESITQVTSTIQESLWSLLITQNLIKLMEWQQISPRSHTNSKKKMAVKSLWVSISIRGIRLILRISSLSYSLTKETEEFISQLSFVMRHHSLTISPRTKTKWGTYNNIRSPVLKLEKIKLKSL